MTGGPQPGQPKRGKDEQFLIESLTPNFGHFIRVSELLYEGQTEFQKIELFDSPQFGKALRLDNVFQTSAGDEYFYHEMMVHPALITHPNPERVLIIGAGDGGMAEEALKHNTVREVVMVEIDGQVVDFSKKYLGDIHRGAFDDPRMQLVIGDGYQWVMEAAERGEHFDAVILDLTDPIGPSRPLYTVEYYAAIARLIGHTGIHVQHLENPVTRKELFAQLVANVRAVYHHVHPLLQYVPLYGTLWSFCNASQTLDPRGMSPVQVESRIRARGLTDLQVYNGDTHRAAYALPNFVRTLMDSDAQPIHLNQIERFDAITAVSESTDHLRIIVGGDSPQR
ncbi:MAG: polyamine aminopropyltransferase [Nitrospirota bacterium]|nr:polyamine aminopropyltransferase [Nitrospirota bacterium]